MSVIKHMSCHTEILMVICHYGRAIDTLLLNKVVGIKNLSIKSLKFIRFVALGIARGI